MSGEMGLCGSKLGSAQYLVRWKILSACRSIRILQATVIIPITRSRRNSGDTSLADMVIDGFAMCKTVAVHMW